MVFTAIRERRADPFQVFNFVSIAPKNELEWIWIYTGSPAENEVHVYYQKKILSNTLGNDQQKTF